MLDFKTPPLNNSLSQLFYKQEVIAVLRCIMKLPDICFQTGNQIKKFKLYFTKFIY